MKIILFNKPFNVLCQFSSHEDKKTLADYIKIPNYYAAGRLDYDSEGLLLLTDSGDLNHLITSPRFKMDKTYLVQVEGEITKEAVSNLKRGVKLKDGLTKPAKVRIISEPLVWERNPPIRERKKIPTSWIEMTINEGRNRQVRRMTASVGFPTLRLIRSKIALWELGDLKSGEYKIVEVTDLDIKRLKHNKYDSV